MTLCNDLLRMGSLSLDRRITSFYKKSQVCPFLKYENVWNT
jgi:hypothetical protein